MFSKLSLLNVCICNPGPECVLSQVYDLPASVKGRAVIVKNIIYEEETQLMKRGRADMDTYKLENTLKKLRYRVKQHTDQTAEVSVCGLCG